MKSITSLLKEPNVDNRELCVHCGYVDNQVLKNSSYNIQRLDGMDLLLSEDFKMYLQINNIILVKY